MSELNLNNGNNVDSIEESAKPVTEAEIQKLYNEYKKQNFKYSFKASRITTLFMLLIIGAIVLTVSFIEKSMLALIPLLCIPILIVVFIVVVVKISKPIRALNKELKAKLNENPEVKKSFNKKMRKSYLIRFVIFIVLLILLASFLDSGSSSDPYDGYSADYKYNEEYRENVDKIAGDYGEDAKDVDRVIQNIAGDK